MTAGQRACAAGGEQREGGVMDIPDEMKRFVDEAPERQDAIMRRWLADPRVAAVLRRYDHEIKGTCCRTCRFWTANRDSTEHVRVCGSERSDRPGHWAPANHGCQAWEPHPVAGGRR